MMIMILILRCKDSRLPCASNKYLAIYIYDYIYIAMLIYIYIYIYPVIIICMYIYIYREREIYRYISLLYNRDELYTYTLIIERLSQRFLGPPRLSQ